MTFSLKNLISIAAAGMLLAGCVNLDPVPDDTRFYVLGDAPLDVPEHSGDEIRVGVRVAWVAAYLRRTGIVTRTRAHELKYSNEHRWAGRIEGSILRVLVLGMRDELPDLAVVPVSGVQPSPPQYVVEVMVSACEGTADGRAFLELSWRILDKVSRERIRTGGFSELKDGWDQQDYEQLAGLLSDLGKQAAAFIAKDVGKVIAEADGPADA